MVSAFGPAGTVSDETEDAIVIAERHVRETEERIAQQVAHGDRLREAGRRREADGARAVLEAMRVTLEMARAHLLVARACLDSQSDGP
jgi:hypothetical protein